MKKNLYLFLLLAWLVFPGAVWGQDVTFSSTRGFYDAPFQLALSTGLAGGRVRYTTDGSVPTPTAGTLYAGPIAVATTSVVRAVAYAGAVATPVATHSYLFLNDVLRQPKTVAGWPNHAYALGAGAATAVHDYEMDPAVVNAPAYRTAAKTGLTAIPTMSLVLNKDDFWDLYEGDASHPTSVEVFYPDGAKEQFDCALGPHSTNRLKRSLALGFSTRVTTQLLQKAPFNGPGTATTFKDTKIVLRAGNNRSWARNWNPDRTAYTRDEWYRESQQAISGEGGRGTFVHLYVNGLYWGLYNPVERTDKGMLANYFGGANADWMALDQDGIRSGDATRFNYLTTALVNQDLRVPANYAQFQQYLDVTKFCDYLILTWMAGMGDWPNNNFHGANRNAPAQPFWYNAWDCEWSWDVTNGSNLGAWVHPEFRVATPGTSTLAKLWHAARRNPAFLQLFADRVYRNCFNAGGLTDAAARARWARVNNFIQTAIVAESARWGDALGDGVTRTRDGYWAPEVARVDGLMNGNVARLVAALVAEGYYPTVGAPGFGQEGGAVAPGFALVLTNPNAGGTVYYTTDGTDPAAAAGAVAAGARAYAGPVAIAGSGAVKARVLSGTAWSPLHEAAFTVSGLVTGLFINEFVASNTKYADEFGEFDDWIEIYNAGAQPVDLGGLYLTDDLAVPNKFQLSTTSPALTTVPAKGFLLLWADNQPAQGPLHVGFKLSAGGGQLGLADVAGPDVSVIDSLRYGPQAANVSRGRYPDAGKLFKPFAAPTPGAPNVSPAITGLFINEFVASNTKYADEFGEFDDWIEIYNAGTQPVDLGGLYLTDDLAVPNKFQLSTTSPALTTVPAKGFLLLWADDQPAQGPLHVGFKLSAGGEAIGLYQPTGAAAATALDTHAFDAQVADVSSGRQPDGAATFVSFAQPTPKASNGAPVASGPQVLSFTLVRAGTGPDLQPLANGAVLNLAALPAGGLNVRANAGAGAVGSVVLALSGAQARTQVEGVAPYALFGDANGSYAAWAPALGAYTLTATPYAGPGGTGAAGPPLTVNFAVVNQPVGGNPAPVANAGPDQALALPRSSTALAGSGTDDGTIAGYAWAQVSGPAAATFSPNAAVAAPTVSGLAVAGTYVFSLIVTDNLGAPSAADLVAVAVAPAPPTGALQVLSFSLINADTGQPLRPLATGDAVALAALPTPRLNVRANTNPAAVGSVVFALSGAQARAQTETVAPYALFGDTNGTYVPWTPALGAYTLTATPYAGPGGTGSAGIPLTINFSVAATPAARGGASAPAVAAAAVFPNPSGDGRVVVALPEAFAGEVTYALVSAMGARVATGTFACPGPGGTQALDFSGHMPAAGVYYLHLTGGQAQAHLKLLRR